MALLALQKNFYGIFFKFHAILDNSNISFQKGLEWPCPLSAALKKQSLQLKIFVNNNYVNYAHVNKPWIIIDKPPKKYSPIDVPLYFLENEILWEHYELNSMSFHNSLVMSDGEKFIWNQNISPDFFERRGNFNNITLFGMTDAETTFNQLPTDFEKTANPSKEIPETYEVIANIQ